MIPVGRDSVRRGFALAGAATLGWGLLASIAAASPAPEAFERFARELDRTVESAMREHDVPGSAVVVVRDGTVALARGYGWADRERKIPVDPARTVFRIGSVSKLLVATAAMQQVERGRLALDRPVNRDLEAFILPGPHGARTTLRHLLTHTAAFDDRFLAIARRRPSELDPLARHLARRLPRQVAPPGQVVHYSNYGIVLAARLVELAAGRPFEAVVDDDIAAPLGMARGGFDQPLPLALSGHLATAYARRNGRSVADPPGEAASQVWPAGAYAATPLDMARFMLAHLGEGAVDGGRILAAPTAREMHRRQFQHDPRLTRGRALGWNDRMLGGWRAIWHTGRVHHFTAQLMLVPTAGLGFFQVSNADRGDRMRVALAELVARHLLPERSGPSERSRVASDVELSPFVGRYRQTRHVRDGIEKLAMWGAEMRVEADASGRPVTPPFGEILGTSEWVPIGPDLFEARGPLGPRRLAFRRDAAGEVTHAFAEFPEFTSQDAFERLAWWEGTPAQRNLVIGAAGILLGVALRAPAHRRRVRHRAARRAWTLLAWVAALLLGFGLALGVTLGSLDPTRIVFGFPPLLAGVLWLAWLPVLLAGALLAGVTSRSVWTGIPAAGRVELAAGLAAVAVLIAQLHYWNLLGPRG